MNYTDVELIKTTCNSGGLLLQPSRPLFTIDAKFSIGERVVPGLA